MGAEDVLETATVNELCSLTKQLLTVSLLWDSVLSNVSPTPPFHRNSTHR